MARRANKKETTKQDEKVKEKEPVQVEKKKNPRELVKFEIKSMNGGKLVIETPEIGYKGSERMKANVISIIEHVSMPVERRIAEAVVERFGKDDIKILKTEE